MQDLGKRLARETDWKDLDPVHQTVTCRCGCRFRSHHRLVDYDGLLGLSQLGCPRCGSHIHARQVEGDPEGQALHG